MREYKVLGLQFYEYPLKEANEIFKELMKAPGIHLASCISSEEILKIVDSTQYKELFEKFEFVISSGYSDDSKEVSNKGEEILFSLFRSFMASKDGIYLLCDTKEHLNHLKDVLDKYSTVTENKFEIVGEDIYDELNKEAIYNRINMHCPKLIFSTMSFEMQYHVMMEGRKLLNASVWMGLIPSVINNLRNGKSMWNQGVIRKLDFKRRIEKEQKSRK